MKTFIKHFSVAVIIFSLLGDMFAQELEFIEKDGGVLLQEGNREIYFYQIETKSKDGKYPRANYIHPLYGLNGEVLTEDFPDDHLHHRGVFWAWHQLFVNDFRVGDPWACEGITWDVSKVDILVSEGKAELKAEVFWLGASSGETSDTKERLIKEEVKITYLKSGEGNMEIEFDIKLVALMDGIRIGGSEDDKGYSGFSARVFLPEDISFHSKKGEVEPRVTAIQGGNWIDMKGTFDQKGGNKSGITIMMDPNYSQPFHGWILRKKNSMQNPAFPGREPIKLEMDNPCRMRYMMLIHEESLDTRGINKLYKKFIRGS